MSVEIRIPVLGESIVDGVIAAWLKHEGDAVRQGEALLELETDKINVEVTAEQSGVLQKMLKKEGDTVAVGEVVGTIAEDGGTRNEERGTRNEETVAAQPVAVASAPAPQSQTAQVVAAPAPTPQAAQVAPPPSTTTQASPLPPTPVARLVAAEHEVDLSQVRGSSPQGRVMKDDVLGYIGQNAARPAEQPAAAPAPVAPVAAQPAPPVGNGVTAPTPVSRPATPAAPTPAAPTPAVPASTSGTTSREERVRLSRRRQTIAQRLVEAQHTAAMLTTFNEVDMSAVMDVRTRRKDSFKERHEVSLGFMSFFTKAIVGALKAFPRLNAEIQGNEMLLKHYYDIGIAVGAEEGLVVPVVRDADRKSFAQIEREIADLGKRAKSNTLTLAELQGGTFTITNGGVFGSLLSTPILNAPQVGILGMHKIEQRPIALKGEVVIRPMMYLALSYDHRIVDGSEAVRFLVRVKELIEDSEALLLEG